MSENSDPALPKIKPPRPTKPLLPKIKLAAAVLMAAVIVTVILQNREPVETKFLFATFTMPGAALLLLTFLFGCALGVLVAWFRPWRKQR